MSLRVYRPTPKTSLTITICGGKPRENVGPHYVTHFGIETILNKNYSVRFINGVVYRRFNEKRLFMTISDNGVSFPFPLPTIPETWRFPPFSPRMATTSSSWMTSSEPVTMKHSESMDSPVWKSKSPGAEWLIVKCMASARKHPSLAKRKAGCSLNTLRLR